MGKNKQGQRTKNNVRPSSSGRSAEMLGTAPINPFMSFSSLKESLGMDEQQMDSSVDPNFQLVLKKMNKKDATTKLKALQEFVQLCEASEAEGIVAILPFWPRLYSVLALDVEHRVREATHVAHRAVVTRVKRNIAPYLKQLAGPWFVAQCDPHAPAATAATRAFVETFPPQKLAEAIAFCQEEILNYITENLIVHTPATLCNTKTMTAEEMEAKYIRTVISSLQGYGLYLKSLSNDQLKAAEELNSRLVSDKKFWNYAKHESPQVRSAWFGMLIPLCQRASFLLMGKEKFVGLAVFGALDENDPSVITTVWEATLMALLSLDGLWGAVSLEKLVLPKLLRVCREAGKGSAAAIFPSLLPLLSKLPSEVIGDTSAFYHRFFGSIRQGFHQRSVQQSRSEAHAVANTFTECIQYVVQLHQKDEILCQELVAQHLFPSILISLMEPAWRAHMSSALHGSVSALFHAWGHAPDGSLQQRLVTFACAQLSASLCDMTLRCETANTLASATPQDGSTPDSATSAESEVEPDEEAKKQIAVDPTDESKTLSAIGPSLTFETTSLRTNTDIKTLLTAHVKLMCGLLGGHAILQQVRFSDESKEEIRKQVDSRSPFTNAELFRLGTTLCCCYLTAARTFNAPHYLLPISNLAKILESLDFFKSLATVSSLSSERYLFPEILSPWLQPDSPMFCRPVMTLCTLLFRNLPEEDHSQLLNQLLKDGGSSLDPNLVLWMLEDGMELGGPALTLLQDPQLIVPLRTLTKEAIETADRNMWHLLTRGSGVTSEGDHVFSHAALQEILQVIDEELRKLSAVNEPLPSWVNAAAGVLATLYSALSPFLRTMSMPVPPLSAHFKICLRPSLPEPYKTVMSLVWRNGAQSLARIHGATSHVIMELCAAFRHHVLSEVLAQNEVPMSTLNHIASKISECITVVSSSVEEPEKRARVCSLLLLNAMLGASPNVDDGPDALLLQQQLTEQWSALQALACCALAFHSGVTIGLTIPPGSQMRILCMGRWSFLITSVLQELLSPSNAEPLPSSTNKEEGRVCDLTFLADAVHLHTRIKFIVNHLSGSELGCALLPLKDRVDTILQKLLTNLSQSDRINVHNLLICPEEGPEDHKPSILQERALWEEAHKLWHTLLACESPLETCEHYVSAMTKDLPQSDSGSLASMDLSTLDMLSERIQKDASNPVVREHAQLWLNTVHSLHRLHRQRLLLSCNVQTCSPSSVHDAVRVLTFLANIVEHLPHLLASDHWDQVIVALASWVHSAHLTVMALDMSDGASHLPAYTFLYGVSHLYVALMNLLEAVRDGRTQLSEPPEGRARLEETLHREWSDVFAGECEHKLLAVWAAFLESLGPADNVTPLLVALLDALGWALAHVSTAFLVATQEPGAPVRYEPLLNLVKPRLLHGLGTVRLAAYHLLGKIVPHMVQSDAQKLAAVSSKAESGEVPTASAEQLSLPQLDDVLTPAQTVVATMLSDVRLGTTCTVRPFTDAYTYTSGYLLTWSLALKMCGAAETELRYQYATWLKSGNYAECLLNSVFCLLPEEALLHTDGKKRKQMDLFIVKPKFQFGECWSSAWVEHLACSVLRDALGRLPALARQWWTDSEPKSATIIERVVAEHLSPLLCAEEMAAVGHQQEKAVDNMVVRVHPAVREVVATYTVDDLAMELVVRLPTNHPLSPMAVEVGKRNAAAAVQWRQWLMQLTMFLTHQNGSLWDGLALWRNNVVRRYEGVEECYICFCVLSGSTYQLPKLSCRTCRKKFHSTCLYKWFQTSNKSTCPICRNLF